MTDPRHDLGLAAEDAVAAWLTRTGWSVVARRLRSRHGGEIDLVAIDPGEVLVAIEVRARRGRRAGSALETVDPRRVARLRRTLLEHARGTSGRHAGLRVDLVGVEPDGEAGRWRLRRLAGIG